MNSDLRNILFTLAKSLLLVTVIWCSSAADGFAQGRPLTFEDIMKWEDISDAEISDNGQWVIYSVWPDRGDGEVQVRSTTGNTQYTIVRGDNPKVTKNGRWVGTTVKVPMEEQLKAKKGNKSVPGLGLLNTETGETIRKDSVAAFSFSNDGNWVAIRQHQSKEVEDSSQKNKKLGTKVVLRNLNTGNEIFIPFVSDAAFDSTSRYFAYSVVDTAGAQNGLFIQNLTTNGEALQVAGEENAYYSNLTWNNQTNQLAFTSAKFDSSYQLDDAQLAVWDPGAKRYSIVVGNSNMEDRWALRSNNDLKWSEDGKRLFFGLMSQEMVDADMKEEKDTTESVDVYDTKEILEGKELDIWHWDDPRIKPHERQTWSERKDHLYRAVYHTADDKWVQLANQAMPDVSVPTNADFALGSSAVPYLKEMTWDGFFRDYFVVNLHTGKRQQIASRLQSGARLSPDGQHVVFYEDGQWHQYVVEEDIYRNLTQGLGVKFANEDHDYPYPAPGYGIGGWVADDKSVLIYDKYDIWKFPLDGGEPVNLTQDGRQKQLMYRIERLDKEQFWFDENEELLLRAYFDKKKTYGFYTLQVNSPGTDLKLDGEKKFDVVAKAQNSDYILYTRESYDEYPNLWVADNLNFSDIRQLTSLHASLHETYNWGTAELIEWQSLDGDTIQGAVIKPDNYEEGKQYPVMVYYYRFFSQRAYEFNNITNDDRPVLPQYVSDGYVVFLPDIRFEVGTPGFASTKSLVPGVQKLVDMGIADPNKLGLHGHSWSGYQTAFMITQTDIFDAAIAGAPVSNMTSAYSGIRLGSGLARQFQYEQTQSRIGGSLWEYPERYIENSPVFFADRINTPLLIMFGDEDTAVPWEQGIELYLAMRRLGKDAVFLQYHDEPHHLQKYANRLDYAIKMKQYFDHYLRGTPAPEWITKGVPYRGE